MHRRAPDFLLFDYLPRVKFYVVPLRIFRNLVIKYKLVNSYKGMIRVQVKTKAREKSKIEGSTARTLL